MKKHPKKLILNRETLHSLEAKKGDAVGGARTVWCSEDTCTCESQCSPCVITKPVTVCMHCTGTENC